MYQMRPARKSSSSRARSARIRSGATATARAGAEGFEVRRELFASDADARSDALARLGERVRAQGLWTVYSTPATLFREDGSLDADALRLAIQEAAMLGARIVGRHGKPCRERRRHAGSSDNDDCHVESARRRGERATEGGGTIGAFEALFAALPKHSGLAMTFDTGNWNWAEQDPLDAAKRLAPYVAYVHCKAVIGGGARRFAAAPANGDASFATLLAHLPGAVPRARH